MKTIPNSFVAEESSARGSGARRSSEIEAAIASTKAEFAALESEWDELYKHCPKVTPFQSWAWLYSWWEAYGDEREYRLRIVTLRRQSDGLLVGLLPLMLEVKRTGRVLLVGTGLSDYLDVLIRAGFEQETRRAGCWALAEIGAFRVMDLQQLRPEAAAWEMFGAWEGFGVRVWQENCPMVELQPWKELVAALSRNNRSVVRRNIKRVAKDGVSRGLAGPERAGEAAGILVDLHREAWEDSDIAPEHLSERFELCLRAAAERMTVRGLAGISEFRQENGEVIGGDFLIFGRETIGSYVQGAAQKALKRYQLSSLYIWDAVNLAGGGDFAFFDWMRGQEDYKLRWSPTLVPSYRLILSRSPLMWAPYAGYHLLRSGTKAYVYSGDAPQWAVSAAKRVNLAAKRFKDRRSGLRSSTHRTHRAPGPERP